MTTDLFEFISISYIYLSKIIQMELIAYSLIYIYTIYYIAIIPFELRRY
jgi:hypothetical protein